MKHPEGLENEKMSQPLHIVFEITLEESLCSQRPGERKQFETF